MVKIWLSQVGTGIKTFLDVESRIHDRGFVAGMQSINCDTNPGEFWSDLEIPNSKMLPPAHKTNDQLKTREKLTKSGGKKMVFFIFRMLHWSQKVPRQCPMLLKSSAKS